MRRKMDREMCNVKCEITDQRSACLQVKQQRTEPTQIKEYM